MSVIGRLNEAADERERILVAAVREAEWLIGQLAPGMRHLALQDYERINSAMLTIGRAAALVKGMA